ncbi:sensor histidine kinase [Amycolatopsis sp. FDAARGOS 1241]|uniref:sensor histidine kinase n=1 Tax=Amycolatopsis sp. FDAARGOS 1241 TaxID=2778070 RepID=UPI00194F3FC6|nr:histidine kinase [Amycolatopsis sp. FDAARGOS 1241]QRP44078.1 sensor histidine kinase [Amycolatopsis sp. FDAARGOS 1241]
MATTTTGNRGRLGTPDWVRWGFVVFPMLLSIPYFAHWWSWTLFGITLVASAPLLRATAESKPRWVLPAAMPVVVAASAALWVLQPNSWVSVAMFSTAFYTMRAFGKLLSAVVLATTAAAIVAWVVLRELEWLNALALFAILAVMILLAASRRDRAARLEQTELALARAQTAAEEHARAAALAERARIAREVHDVLAHSLAGLALNLQGARLMLVRDGASSEALAQIERAQKLASDGLSEARKAVAALREDAVPVERAVADLLAAYRLDTGARADLVVAGDPRELDAAVNTTLVRAVQEALANTRKHAPGAAVDVMLAFAGQQVELTVLDRQGRRPPDAPAPGYGLRGMGERVALLEGKLESGPGEDGWRIHLTVPA